jgi:hypothetical protein
MNKDYFFELFGANTSTSSSPANGPITASTPTAPDGSGTQGTLFPNPFPPLPGDYYTDAFGYIHPKSSSLPTGQCPIVEHPEHNSFATEYKTVYVGDECEHISINVGFTRAKFVCKKCDKVLEE